MRKYLILSICLLLQACSAKGPAFNSAAPPLSSQDTGLYVYRTAHVIGSLGGTYVFVDNKNIGYLRDNGYIYTKLMPGTHTLSVPDKSNIFVTAYIKHSFSVRNHSISYIKLRFIPDGKSTWSGGVPLPEYNWSLQEVPPSIAKTEMAKTHLSN